MEQEQRQQKIRNKSSKHLCCIMDEKKRTRVTHSLATKLEVLRRTEKGQSKKQITEAMGLAPSTIFSIRMRASFIKAEAKKLQLKHASKSTIPKKKSSTSSSSSSEVRKFSLNSRTTMRVLSRARKGMTSMQIARDLHLSQTLVSSMIKVMLKEKADLGKASSCKVLVSRMSLKDIPKIKTKKLTGNEVHIKGKPYSLATRLEVVKRCESGEKKCDVAKDMGLPVSTVSDMVRRSKQIKADARILQVKKTPTVEKIKTQNGEKRKVHYVKKKKIQNVKKKKVQSEAKRTYNGEARKTPKAVSVKEEVNGGCGKNIVIENMERLLKIWIDEEQQSHPSALNDDTIQRKALSLHSFVWNSLGSEETKGMINNFTASSLWLRQFKRTIGLDESPIQHLPALQPTVSKCELQEQLHPTPTPTPPPALTPTIIQIQSLPQLSKIGVKRSDSAPPMNRIGVSRGVSSLLRAKIEVGGYTAQQVINVDEMVLFWKKPLPNTVIGMVDTTVSDSRDQFSLLFGSNATGDLKLKPLLVYHMDNPASLRGYIKEYLPVIWRSHPWGRVVSALCQNYVVDYLSQRCKEYAMQHNIPNRFLLLVDDSPVYPPSMEDWADNIEVMFVPTMSTSVVQPMENGITTAFRLCYLHRLMLHLTREINAEDKDSLSKFWQNYTIRKALANIRMAWEDVTPYTLNAAWQSIWPECVRNVYGCGLISEPTEVDVVRLAHEAGFLQVNLQDVQELLNTPNEDMSTEELYQRQLQQALQEQTEESEVEVIRTLDVTLLNHALSLFDEALSVLEDNDPNCTRNCDAQNYVEQGIRSYRELFNAKKRKAHNSSILSSHYK